MSRRFGVVLLAAAVSLAALLAGYFGLRPEPPSAPRASRAAAQTPSPPPPGALEPSPSQLPPARPVDAPPTVAPSSSGAGSLDEPTLMSKLRELRSSDPGLTLQLARDGNVRFPNSADAAERAWFVVKALTDLGRHDEARVEGRELLERYRGSRWAEDVYRHLFVNPPTHPFERGYGKQLESDP